MGFARFYLTAPGILVADDPSRVVTVEIMGQRYPIRSALDIEYITHLANYVDEKIQTATEHSTGGDTVRIAVLAALNIADEYFRARATEAHLGENLQERASEIEQLVDRALDQFS
ncbi:MAG: cell division protein ZapA [Acidobacteria bacterium]|nr:cell division protein ZapA [Acidobacteriota bacterium]MDP7339538.1 cell division protein ZapA [Vicinamibacterales bacterium]MDP7479506.1 cell division protein ZapA [Vicinamibacterales bacterium]HJN45481.1 cell division protein ZapA [Vicinamibacterales bacterium]